MIGVVVAWKTSSSDFPWRLVVDMSSREFSSMLHSIKAITITQKQEFFFEWLS